MGPACRLPDVARRIARTVEDPVADVPERPSLLAVADIAAWEQHHDVLQILDQLPVRQRQVLAWSLGGYTPTEIGTDLKMTADAVRARLAVHHMHYLSMIVTHSKRTLIGMPGRSVLVDMLGSGTGGHVRGEDVVRVASRFLRARS
jgi:hypothetical protein